MNTSDAWAKSPPTMSETVRAQTLRDVAAYLLDRADQYETDSPCWIALADVAENLMRGALDEAIADGVLDKALYARVDSMPRD